MIKEVWRDNEGIDDYASSTNVRFNFHACKPFRSLAINTERGTIIYYDEQRGHSRCISIESFAEWAFRPQSGLSKEQRKLIKDGHNYHVVMADHDIPPGCVGEYIRGLKSTIERLEKELESKKAHGWAHGRVACIDCESLDLSTVIDGIGLCKKLVRKFNAQCIYLLRYCKYFNPAVKGCGDAEQALRAELARVAKDKDGK